MESWSNVSRNYRNSRRNSCRGDTAVHRGSALLLSTPGTFLSFKRVKLSGSATEQDNELGEVAKRRLKVRTVCSIYQSKRTDKGAELCC